jgi:hypothetical protein
MSQQHIDALENCQLVAGEACKLYEVLADSMEEFHELVEDYGGEEGGGANVAVLDLPVRGWADRVAAHRLVVQDLEQIIEYCLGQKPRTADHRLAIKLTTPILKKAKAALAVLDSLPPPPPPPSGGGGRLRRAA